MSHYVYLVECRDGTLYTGYTTDLVRRLEAHNQGRGAKYTRARRPVRLIAAWDLPSKSDALKEEYRIKRLSRLQKLALVQAAQRLSPNPLVPLC